MQGPTDDQDLLRQRIDVAIGRGDTDAIATIRDEIVHKHDQLGNLTVAFVDDLKAHDLLPEGPEWDALKERVEVERKRQVIKAERACDAHLDAREEIKRHWGDDIFTRNNWGDGQTRTKLVLKCARKWQKLKKEFVPHANLVVWLRHQRATARLDSRPNQFIDAPGKLTTAEWECLAYLPHGERTIHGESINIHSAEKFRDRIHEWTTGDGSLVLLDGRRLDSVRRRDPDRYLLGIDPQHGLLKRRDHDSGATLTAADNDDGEISSVTSKQTSVSTNVAVHEATISPGDEEGPDVLVLTPTEPIHDNHAISIRVVRGGHEGDTAAERGDETPGSSWLSDSVPTLVNPTPTSDSTALKQTLFHTLTSAKSLRSSNDGLFVSEDEPGDEARSVLQLVEEGVTEEDGLTDGMEAAATEMSHSYQQTRHKEKEGLGEHELEEHESEDTEEQEQDLEELELEEQDNMEETNIPGHDNSQSRTVTCSIAGKGATSTNDLEVMAQETSKTRRADQSSNDDAAVVPMEGNDQEWVEVSMNDGSISRSCGDGHGGTEANERPQDTTAKALQRVASECGHVDGAVVDLSPLDNHCHTDTSVVTPIGRAIYGPRTTGSGLGDWNGLWDMSTPSQSSGYSAATPWFPMDSPNSASPIGSILHRGPFRVFPPSSPPTSPLTPSPVPPRTAVSTSHCSTYNNGAHYGTELLPTETVSTLPEIDGNVTRRTSESHRNLAVGSAPSDRTKRTVAGHAKLCSSGRTTPRMDATLRTARFTDHRQPLRTRAAVHPKRLTAPSLSVPSSGRDAGPTSRDGSDIHRPINVREVLEQARGELRDTVADAAYVMPRKWLLGTEPATLFVPRDSSDRRTERSEADGEVCHASLGTIEAAMCGDAILDRPVVIRETANDDRLHSIESVISSLRSYRSPSASWKVLHAHSSETLDVETADLMEIIGNGTDSITVQESDIIQAHQPTVSLLPRFQLLHTAAVRASQWSSRPGQVRPRHADDCSPCPSRVQVLNRIQTPGAFCGPHVSSGGTCIRQVMGTCICFFVSRKRMETEWDAFAAAGPAWDPAGKQRAVLLERGDVLLVPASFVLAFYAIDTCVALQAALWEDGDIVNSLQSMLWAAKHPQCATGPFLPQPQRILAAMGDLVDENPARFAGDEQHHVFKKQFEQVVSDWEHFFDDDAVENSTRRDEASIVDDLDGASATTASPRKSKRRRVK